MNSTQDPRLQNLGRTLINSEYKPDDPIRIDGFLRTLDEACPLEEFPFSALVIVPPPAKL